MPSVTSQLPIKQFRQATSIEDWHQAVRQLAEMETPIRTVLIYPSEDWLETESQYIHDNFANSLTCVLKEDLTPNYRRSLLTQFKVGQHHFLLTTAKQWLKPDVCKTLQSELSPFIFVVFEAELAVGTKHKNPAQKDYAKLATLNWMQTDNIIKVLRTQAPIKDEAALKKAYGLEEPEILFTSDVSDKAMVVNANVAFKVKRTLSQWQKVKFIQHAVNHSEHRWVVFVEDVKDQLPLLEQKLQPLLERYKDRLQLLTPQLLPEMLTQYKTTRDEVSFVYWQLPTTLPDLLQPQWWLPNSRRLQVLVLYTKEDFTQRQAKIKFGLSNNLSGLKKVIDSNNKVRQFCNSANLCRVNTLLKLNGQDENLPPCGRCDICTHDKPLWNPLQYVVY